MANIKSAKKRARQNVKRREHNASLRSRMRTHVKNVLKAIEAANHEQALAAFSAAQSMLDKAAKKGLIHKNKVARHKRRLSAHIKALETT